MSRSELNCDDSDGYEEIASLVNRPSALDLIAPHHRTLWCEIPEVKNSGILGNNIFFFTSSHLRIIEKVINRVIKKMYLE